MKESKVLGEVFRPKDLRNPYMLASLAGTVACRAERGSYTSKSLDRLIGKIALSEFENAPKPQEKLEVPLWHGTGRYRYIDGQVVDVLDSMATVDSIVPHHDKFDLLRPMDSVSLAKARMYARSYADMHGKGHNEEGRYGSSLFWACAFLGSIAVEAATESKVWTPSGYKKMIGHLAVADTVEWYKKVTTKDRPGVVEVYKSGSDIKENYPVLFAVDNVEPTKTSKSVSLHEVRTEQPIRISEEILHVEVPRSKIEETKKVLGGVSIRAIEGSEYLCSAFTFTDHMHAEV